jgi:hypothetical protein
LEALGGVAVVAGGAGLRLQGSPAVSQLSTWFIQHHDGRGSLNMDWPKDRNWLFGLFILAGLLSALLLAGCSSSVVAPNCSFKYTRFEVTAPQPGSYRVAAVESVYVCKHY